MARPNGASIMTSFDACPIEWIMDMTGEKKKQGQKKEMMAGRIYRSGKKKKGIVIISMWFFFFLLLRSLCLWKPVYAIDVTLNQNDKYTQSRCKTSEDLETLFK